MFTVSLNDITVGHARFHSAKFLSDERENRYITFSYNLSLMLLHTCSLVTKMRTRNKRTDLEIGFVSSNLEPKTGRKTGSFQLVTGRERSFNENDENKSVPLCRLHFYARSSSHVSNFFHVIL